MSPTRLHLGLLLVIALVLASGAAWGQREAASSSRALEHFGRGVVLHNAHEYAKAAAAFAAAYAEEPRRDFLFAWAQAERLAGNCPAAIRLYRKLLLAPTPAKQLAVIRGALARCGDTAPLPVPSPPASAPASMGAAATQAAPDAPSARHPASEPLLVAPLAAKRPWYRDPAGGALCGVGVAALGAAAGLLGVAVRDDDRAATQSIYRDFARYHVRAGEERLAGWITLGVGAGLVVAGVVRYLLRGGHERRVSTALRLDPVSGMIRVVWR